MRTSKQVDKQNLGQVEEVLLSTCLEYLPGWSKGNCWSRKNNRESEEDNVTVLITFTSKAIAPIMSSSLTFP